MALTDKNLVLTPNIGSGSDPQIVFSGADGSTAAQNITMKVYPTNNGTLSFEGTAGQLFSITNTFTGTVFSANDISGIPSIEVLDTGIVRLAQYSGAVVVGGTTWDGSCKLQVNGTITETSSIALKENINPIEDALFKVMQLVGVTYDRIDGSTKSEAGLIAEKVNEVIPEIVAKDKDGNIVGIHYSRLTTYLLEAIKALKSEINEIKGIK